ncbi:MAG: hypothetical protein Q7J68_02520, partial [Thermoplasmata archaeon]|nr:hypothetical protein [Thermoplasmata archaeon]
VTLEYKNDIGSPFSYIGYILFEIRYRVEVPDVTNLAPGDLNVKKNFQVNFDNSMPGTVTDITITITLPDTGFTWFGVSGATITKTNDGPFEGQWDLDIIPDVWNIQLILSVSSSKAKGDYIGQYTVTYTSSGVGYTETGDVEFQVGDLPMLEVSVGTATLAQGTTKATWSLTFTNVGTVDLLDIKAQLDDDSSAFTDSLADHWENDETVTYSWLELGDIAVGASVIRTMDVGIDLYIPVGVHKVMFYFWGMYYDPDTATYEDVTVGWVDVGAFNNERWLSVNGALINPDESTVRGPYIDITVTDTELDIMLLSTVTLTTGGRILDNTLELKVQNLGNIDYTNVVLQIETNTADSPFTNVVDPTATLSEEAPLASTLWAGTTTWVDIQVSLNPDAELGVYMVPVTITAVNDNMGEAISTVVDARITIRGIGPQLEVTSVTPETIKSGEEFTLTLVLTNVGDDTARNIILNSWLGDDSETTIDGNYAAPMADALPLYLGDLAPGATLTVEVPMRANSDISDGHVYSIVFDIDFVDSFGDGPTTDWIAVTVKSTGNGGSVLATFYWTMVILAFVIAIFLIIVAIVHVKKNRKPKVAPVQEYQAPPPPPSDGMVEP